ncbi:uncharacterized protein LOC130810065 [Amaranthus tricolor]|uniref:uncharacterized protein LOC130810065 n=1 Tax=Amaranthus tricolor TaxID=29722 RepID=UPI0025909996|nr:uncharacterized protein LOC130810065 [Amaranthus tricolor]
MGEEGDQTPKTHDSKIPAPITHTQFLLWKRQKDADASAKRAEAARKREEDIRAGVVQMNGRELFVNEPWVFDNNLY